jgi:hypothetical protein
MDSIKNILNRAHAGHISHQVKIGLIVEYFKECIAGDYGRQAVTQIQTIALKNKELHVTTAAAPLKQEIIMHKERYLKAVCDKFGYEVATDIR